MSNRCRNRNSFYALILLFSGTGAMTSGWTAARFEPPAGHVLLIVGQSVEDVTRYTEAAHSVPGGVMTYTSLKRGEGLDSPFDEGDGTQYAQRLVRTYSDAVVQMGLYLVNDCAPVIHGERDAAIDRLADWIAGTKRPVFLRVGYEFDGPHNHYVPADYILAYRYIVDRMRKRGVTNVAFVWHSYASRLTRPLSDWYPGDDVVDWVGLSYFNQAQHEFQPVIDFSRTHGKPLMIAESSPWNVQTRYANAWNLWFVPLFKFIQANDIKALSYINCDWDSTKQFHQFRWGDTRLQTNPEILEHWLRETDQSRYLKASPDLLRFLNQPAVSDSSTKT